MGSLIDVGYSEEVTEATREEFKNFVRWYNNKRGHEPLIVGGWAVHAYAPTGRGSRDIDVVYPSAEMLDKTLSEYWQANGYRKVRMGLFTVSYEKELQTKGGAPVTIHVDPFCMEEDTVDKNTGIRLTWKLADKYCVRKEIGAGIFVYVPEAELLAAYKIGAILKREKEMKGTPDKSWADHLASKIVKDAYDVVQLFSNCDLDYERVYAFCEYLKITPAYLVACKESVKRHGKNAGIEESIGKFEEEFSHIIETATRFTNAFAALDVRLLLQLKQEFPDLMEKAIDKAFFLLKRALLPEEQIEYLQRLNMVLGDTPALCKYAEKHVSVLDRISAGRHADAAKTASEIAGKIRKAAAK